VDVKKEMDELVGLEKYFPKLRQQKQQQDAKVYEPQTAPESSKDDNGAEDPDDPIDKMYPASEITARQAPPPSALPPSPKPSTKVSSRTDQRGKPASNKDPPVESIATACPMCSSLNDHSIPHCAVCQHSFHKKRDPNQWRCGSKLCENSEFINPGHVEACVVCGAKKEL
jgi:hypothetical protein